MAKTNTAPKPKRNSQAKQPEQSEPQPIPEEPEVPVPITQSDTQPVGDVVALPTTDSVFTASIIHLSHAELFPFKNHPFQLRDDEDKLLNHDDLAAKVDAITGRFHDKGDSLKVIEKAMKRNANLRAAIVDYAKTKDVFDEYKAQKFCTKYLANHEAEIAIHRAAKATMKELLAGEKLPKTEELKTEWQRLLSERKSRYSEYRTAQKDMKTVVAVKANIDQLLGSTEHEKNKADRPQQQDEFVRE